MEDVTYECIERLRSLLRVESNLSNSFRNALDKQAKNLLCGLIPDAASFLCNSLDVKKHNEEDVRTLISAFPDALSYEYNDGELPIHRCAWEENAWPGGAKTLDGRQVPFIPVLAEEGVQLNVGGDQARGGLLTHNEYGFNVLEILCLADVPEGSDLHGMYHGVLERLREMNLFKKEDIQDHELLIGCSLNLFDYLTDWDPIALKDWRSPIFGPGMSLLHNYINTFEIELEDEKVKAIIKAGLKYYPDHLGFVYQKDDEGPTAWEYLCEILGAEETWKIIEDSIKETDNGKVIMEVSGDHSSLSFSPSFLAAVGDMADDMNILYCLLREEPAQWISYLEENFE